jgi:hypothetical protein
MSIGPLVIPRLILTAIAAGIDLLTIATGFAAPLCSDRESLVGIYPAPFGGEPRLARQVSAIVGTELLASLRSADDDIAGSDFGHGVVEPIGNGVPKCSQLLLSGRVLPLALL